MYNMLTWLFHENSFIVVLLESLLILQGKPDIESREVYPGPPPRYIDVGAFAASLRDSVMLPLAPCEKRVFFFFFFFFFF